MLHDAKKLKSTFKLTYRVVHSGQTKVQKIKVEVRVRVEDWSWQQKLLTGKVKKIESSCRLWRTRGKERVEYKLLPTDWRQLDVKNKRERKRKASALKVAQARIQTSEFLVIADDDSTTISENWRYFECSRQIAVCNLVAFSLWLRSQAGRKGGESG